jgi:hypothetical protein
VSLGLGNSYPISPAAQDARDFLKVQRRPLFNPWLRTPQNLREGNKSQNQRLKNKPERRRTLETVELPVSKKKCGFQRKSQFNSSINSSRALRDLESVHFVRFPFFV